MEGMKKEYDFSKARRNPYAKKLKRPVTIRLDEQTIDYFKDLSDGRRVSLDWKRRSKSGAV